VDVALRRVATTAVATLTHTFYVDEEPTASTAPVTVAITDANGDAVTSGTATAGTDTGQYTFTLPPQPAVAQLSVAWSATIAGAAVVETDPVEIVGGYFFSIPGARASDSSLADTSKYPTAALIEARLEVEVECEDICGRAFVPRYRRVVLDGTGTPEIMLPTPDVRAIRSARIAPRYGEAYVPLTADRLALVNVTEDRILRRTDTAWWTEGQSNVIIEYEYGLDAPPVPLREAALVRLRSLINKHRTGIPDRAQSFTSVDGGTYRLAMPGRFTTGLPEVDAVYSRYAIGAGAGVGSNAAALPASRSLDYNPQYLSLYHGGVR
jgi:hypothetical protein